MNGIRRIIAIFTCAAIFISSTGSLAFASDESIDEYVEATEIESETENVEEADYYDVISADNIELSSADIELAAAYTPRKSSPNGVQY